MKKILCILTFSFILISCSNDNKTLKFTKSNFEGEWPFSVDEIEVYCNGYSEIYCKTNNGKVYALNGTAKGISHNNPEISKIEEIWLDNPKFEGLKIPYSFFIEKGLKMCQHK